MGITGKHNFFVRTNYLCGTIGVLGRNWILSYWSGTVHYGSYPRNKLSHVKEFEKANKILMHKVNDGIPLIIFMMVD